MKIELAEFCNKIEVYDQTIKNRKNEDIYLLDIMQKYADEQCAIQRVSQQRELLFAWEKYKKEFPYSDTPISELIEKYVGRK